LAFLGGPHTVLLDATSQHVARVVKIVGGEGQSVQISFVGSSRPNIRVACRRVARVRLLLVLQIAFHKLPNRCRVASGVVLLGDICVVLADTEHGG
jgi:hypothetical protein